MDRSLLTQSMSKSRSTNVNRAAVRAVLAVVLKRYLRSMSAYVSLTLGIVLLFVNVQNLFSVVRNESIVILSDPFLLPLMGMALIGAVFTALITSASVTRELEHGTLEVLFYGPINTGEYLLGTFLAHLFGYCLQLVYFLFACLVFSLFTNLNLTPELYLISLLSIVLAAGFTSFGLFSATWLRTVRGSILFCLGASFLLLLLKVSQTVLQVAVSATGVRAMVVVRDALDLVNRVVDWIAPSSYFLNAIDALIRQDWAIFGLNLFLLISFMGLVFLLARRLLERKGVLR